MLKTFSVQIDDQILALSNYDPVSFQARLNSIVEEVVNQAKKNKLNIVSDLLDEKPDTPEVQAVLIKAEELRQAKIDAEKRRQEENPNPL